MTNIELDVIRIKQKTAQNGIALNPVISIETIREFERNTDVILPEELVRFYTEIGNGCKMLNGFDLRKIEDWDFNVKKINKEFMFDNSWIWEDEPNDDLIGEIYNVNIELIDIGDGQFWNIIINGKECGQMWSFTDVGIQPCAPKRSFLSWFEYWLDGNDDYFTGYMNPKSSS